MSGSYAEYRRESDPNNDPFAADLNAAARAMGMVGAS